MKKFILWCLLLLCSDTIKSQIIYVKDQSNHEPLEVVSIVSDHPKSSIITDEHGSGNITSFKGAERIQFFLLGYKSKVMSFAQLEKAGFIVYLSPSSFSFSQVVVSASRWKQAKREVPMKITKISSKDVALQQPQTAADLLGTSGEVFIQKSQQGGGSPMIRGFASNRVLIAVDGVRMNNAIFRSGNLQNVISLDPFALENTEVLFGPSSVIYGSDAIGGVMSFQTLKPRFSTSDSMKVGGSISSRYSSANDEMTGHADVNVAWEKFALLSSYSRYDYGDLRMGAHGPDDYLRPFYVKSNDSADLIFVNDDPRKQIPTAYSQHNFMQKLRYAPNDKWDLEYAFHHSATGDYSRYDRHIQTKNALPRSAEWYYGPQIWMMNNFSVSHLDSMKLYDEVTLRVALQNFEESRYNRDYGAINRSGRVERVNALSVNLDAIKSLSKKQALFYGIESVYNKVFSSGTEENTISGSIVPGPSRYPDSDWSSYAAYVNYQLKATDKFILLAGTRYNQYMLNASFDTSFYPFPFSTASINKGALTGSVGFAYNPTDKWSFGAGVSSAFRAPNVDDIGKVFDSEPGAVVVPNPNLEAEQAYNFEADVAKVFGEIIKVDVVGYYTLLENALVRRGFSLNGADSILYDGEMSKVQAIQNAAQAFVYGVQAGVEVNLPGAFAFTSRFNYQKGEEELANGAKSSMRHAGPWFGASHLSYTVKKLKIDCYALYNGTLLNKELAEEEKGRAYLYAKDQSGAPYSPGWYTLNIKAQVQATKFLSINCGVENISDQRYRPYSSGLAAAGRNFVLALRAAF